MLGTLSLAALGWKVAAVWMVAERQRLQRQTWPYSEVENEVKNHVAAVYRASRTDRPRRPAHLT